MLEIYIQLTVFLQYIS